MKVLHLYSGNLYGGIESFLVTLARYRDVCPDIAAILQRLQPPTGSGDIMMASMMQSLLARMKSIFLPRGSYPRTILSGAFRGLRMELDFARETQVWMGLYEREVHSWLRYLSRDIKTAFDIGAASGEYALYFLLRTKAERVFAFEPLEESRNRLQRNLCLNPVVQKDRLIVSDQFVSQDSLTGVSLDSFLQAIVAPTLVKMDVEGAEVDVLKGAKRLLEQSTTRWLVETHSAELENRCVDLFQAAGYATFVIHNSWWRRFVRELRPLDQNRWLVAVPQREEVVPCK